MTHKTTWGTGVLRSLGLVFGDIGTSPIYMLTVVVALTAPTEQHILGVLSLIFWTLVLVVTVEYAWLAMSLGTRGEGGTIVLKELLVSLVKSGRQAAFFSFLGYIGISLPIGDGVITPAISILSAVEGLLLIPGLDSTPTKALMAVAGLIAIALFAVHKMGIHASPTCVMAFGDNGGAEGFMVGRPNEGLAAMFTMMNYMRLGVGAQGVGLADRSYQQAVAYARERVPGRAPGERGRVTIIRHPDVRRMLLTMRVLTQASRAICYYTAACLDRSAHGTDPATSAIYEARADLLTPIAKAWSTEAALEVTSNGIQVYGGMGYVEESGVAQSYRDARIAPIYEGTNGIQAIDPWNERASSAGSEIYKTVE